MIDSQLVNNDQKYWSLPPLPGVLRRAGIAGAVLAVTFFPTFLAAQSSQVLPEQPQPAAMPAMPAGPSVTPGGETFRIGIGDVLGISVWKEPDHSVDSLVVRPDGKISIPLLREIDAVGLTPLQLEDALKAEDMFRTLMGEKVEPRREFIEKHALEVKEIDYHGA